MGRPPKTVGTEAFRLFVFLDYYGGFTPFRNSVLSQKCNIFEVFGCLIRQKTRFCQNSVPTLFLRKTTKTDHFGTGRNGELGVISAQGAEGGASEQPIEATVLAM